MKIICAHLEKGAVHNFTILKKSKLGIHSNILILADLGYLGIAKLHQNSWIPHKKSKHNPLTKEQKRDNQILCSLIGKMSNEQTFLLRVDKSIIKLRFKKLNT